MDMAKSALLGIGAVDDVIHQERFVADFSDASALATGDEEAYDLLIEHGSDEYALRIRPGANILAGMLEAGISAPYGCGGGICGTCMCTVVSGSVEQTTVAGLAEDDEASGKILICSSKITENVRLRLG